MLLMHYTTMADSLQEEGYMSTPLFNAPAGTVWASPDYSTLAHLSTSHSFVDCVQSICGVWLDKRVLSLQVGGYSVQPCLFCIGLMWAKMVKTYKAEAVNDNITS